MESNSSVLLTVITPTYNRSNEIRRLTESLMNQTIGGFQWLVIDDGSTDDTEAYFANLQVSKFEIEYHKKDNGGKHTALNYAHSFIKGDYVFIVDSDDYLIPDAIETVSRRIAEFKDNQRIACLSFQRGADSIRPLVEFPNDVSISNHIDFRLNEKRPGDCAEVVRTDVFKEFPFPEFEGERFMSEGYLWVNIALHYDTVYIKKIIYICEYLPGGLTKSGSKLRIKSPLGRMENSNAFLSAKGMPRIRARIALKQVLLYICSGKFAGFKYADMRRKCNRPSMMTICYPMGLLLYVVWKWKYCNE